MAAGKFVTVSAGNRNICSGYSVSAMFLSIILIKSQRVCDKPNRVVKHCREVDVTPSQGRAALGGKAVIFLVKSLLVLL